MTPSTRSIRMRVAALGLVPLTLVGAASAASALDRPARSAAAPAEDAVPVTEAPATSIIERLLTNPGSITLGDVERLVTGGTTFSGDDLVAIVGALAKPTGEPDAASKAYDAFVTSVRRLDGPQLERLFATVRSLTFADIERIWAEGSKLDQRQLATLFTRLSGLSPAELESFLRTASTLPATQLHAFLVYVTR